jgi:hypothetical protein
MLKARREARSASALRAIAFVVGMDVVDEKGLIFLIERVAQIGDAVAWAGGDRFGIHFLGQEIDARKYLVEGPFDSDLGADTVLAQEQHRLHRELTLQGRSPAEGVGGDNSLPQGIFMQNARHDVVEEFWGDRGASRATAACSDGAQLLTSSKPVASNSSALYAERAAVPSK